VGYHAADGVRAHARARGPAAFHRAPKAWRDTFRRITELADGQIRFIGLSSIARRARSPVHPEVLIAMRRWILPESIEDVLPFEARRLERLRRALLDEFRCTAISW
jgi:hypothetical protein